MTGIGAGSMEHWHPAVPERTSGRDLAECRCGALRSRGGIHQPANIFAIMKTTMGETAASASASASEYSVIVAASILARICVPPSLTIAVSATVVGWRRQSGAAQHRCPKCPVSVVLSCCHLFRNVRQCFIVGRCRWLVDVGVGRSGVANRNRKRCLFVVDPIAAPSAF